jgi:exodeoxyribonuclease VII large subunit
MDSVFLWLHKRAIINLQPTRRKRKLLLALSNSPQGSHTALSVSQLNRQVKRLLEGHFDFVWIEGELSNLARPGSGHWYFSLKDDSAQVRCAMFRNRNQRVRLTPRDGQQLLVRARVSLYEGRGEYQLIVEHMEDAGAGALQRAFEQLKGQLSAEGLFLEENKQALPALPARIGIITSASGAAVRDILSVFKRRFPPIELTVLPVPVQGNGAAPAIVKALQLADRADLFDALILARGGGSIEDLWAFNEEAVARAIAACSTPVVSAIGHETDFTIADFVADARAPTPSAAAELLSPDQRELIQGFAKFRSNLAGVLLRHIHLLGQQLKLSRGQLRHPGERLREQGQRLDDCELHLRRSLRQRLDKHHHAIAINSAHLQRLAPEPRLSRYRLLLSQLSERAARAGRHQLQHCQQHLAAATGKLDSLSPLATLQRGYAIVSDSEGKVLGSVKQVKEGGLISTRLADGSLQSRVESID